MGDKDYTNFNSYLEAYTLVHDKFLGLVSLLRSEGNVHDQKLEIYPCLDEKGVVQSYVYAGKVKFSDRTIIEDEGEDIITDLWTVIFQYSLIKEKSDVAMLENEKGAKDTKKERWVLEKIPGHSNEP